MNEICIKSSFISLSTGYHESILINGEYFNSLLKDIELAKHSIDFSVYIYRTDHLGEIFTQAFIKAAQRGVRVRIIIDGIGARFTSKATIKQLLQAGVQVRIYHPLPWQVLHLAQAAHVPESFLQKIFYLLTKINSRNHRKLCIIDQSIVYISSANIDKCHLAKDENGDGWRDTSVKIVDSDVSYITYAFNRAWRRFKVNSRFYPRYHANGKPSIYYFNFTRRLRRKSYKKLLRRIKHAEHRIWITNAYFVPDNNLMNALIAARARGVDVRILLPSTSDVLISSLVANTFYADLLKHQVAIYEYLRGVLHAKIMIIDDWFGLGSSNLNTRSIKHDLEADVILQTLSATTQLEKQFLIDLEASDRIDFEHLKKHSMFKNFLGRLGLFLRNWI